MNICRFRSVAVRPALTGSRLKTTARTEEHEYLELPLFQSLAPLELLGQHLKKPPMIDEARSRTPCWEGNLHQKERRRDSLPSAQLCNSWPG